MSLARIMATFEQNRLALYEPSPALAGFMASTDRRILVRAANRCGKTMAAAAKLCTLMLRVPNRKYRAVGVNYQQSVGVIGQYLADLLPPSALASGCHYTKTNGWSHQLIRLKNGTTCEIRSSEQSGLSHAGSTLHGVWLDEFGPEEILLESLTRVMSYDGWVWQTGTPVGRSVDYFRKLVEVENTEWVQHVVAFNIANVPWLPPEQVEAWIEEQRGWPDSFDQRILGAWDSPTTERLFTGFDSSCLITPDMPLPKGVQLVVGIDHGEKAGRQVAVLVAHNADGLWVLDEEVNTVATTPTDDARAIRAMLQRNDLDVHQIHAWVGDVNSAGKSNMVGFSANDVLAFELCKDAGFHKQAIRIATPMKGPGSVDAGSRLLNHGFLRHKLWVNPRCQQLIKGLRHARGSKADADLTHALDALRYAAYAPLSAMTGNRNIATRYQL